MNARHFLLLALSTSLALCNGLFAQTSSADSNIVVSDFRAAPLQDGSGLRCTFSWASVTDARYSVQRSSDLVAWTTVAEEVTPTPPLNTFVDEIIGAAPQRLFYRVSSVPPEPLPSGFALIPAGSFQMGDSFGDGWTEERPVHTVSVSAYYIGRTKVTYGQWEEVRTWAVASGYTDLAGVGSGKASGHPVHSVSWYDAAKWCNAASERDGLVPVYRTNDGGVYRTGQIDPPIEYSNSGYRLPTEAEWEKAARGGLSGRRFPWGDTIAHSQANYYSEAGYAYDVNATPGFHTSYQSGGYPYTSPVGSFAANGYGVYDTSGNAWEWCNDWWGDGYYASSPEGDPRGPSSGTSRLVRGGSWDGNAYFNRVAFRGLGPPGYRLNYFGFRLARSL